MGKLTDTSVGTGIKRLIKKSTAHLVGISSIGNALLKYLTPTSNEPNSPDCFLSYSLVSDEDLETTEIILKKEWSQILDTWTEAELKADSKKFNTVNSVMIIIESELRDVYSKLHPSIL
ncbi:hypothetical protein, partial [Salmonella enterica]|uniref:hypothetical protein n=1 Tax=Salmonella enterica TaxID=28901 RepID=UPI00352340D7